MSDKKKDQVVETALDKEEVTGKSDIELVKKEKKKEKK